MKITYLLPCGRGSQPRALMSEPAKEPSGKPPRLARLVALAHKLDRLVRSGAVKDYAELAQLGHVSPARLSQIMLLLHLAPAIQELHSVSVAGRGEVRHRTGATQNRPRGALGPAA